MKEKYLVNIIETEAGWGSKIDDQRFFYTKEEAEEFVKKFNEENNKSFVPDWYMYAENPVKISIEL